MINRDKYLKQLIDSMGNGMPKVITGIRRCGKSYLLKNIFKDYLLSKQVNEKNIVSLDLDDADNFQYHNPLKLMRFIKEQISSDDMTYVFIDEIQLVMTIVNPELTDGRIKLAKKDDLDVISFANVVLSISKMKNVDLYVTGSNSKLLSKDIVTEFRDKATNIHLQPLSFEEYYNYIQGEPYVALNDYLRYGGMPLAVLSAEENKESYLKNLFETTYFKDICEHNKLRKSETLDEIADAISSESGQLLNSIRIAHILESRKQEKKDKSTIERYLDFFMDSYLISEVKRYDVKGNDFIGSSRKYYFTDLGLRNARLDFSSLDMGQMLENLVYNELVYHGYHVRVGTFNMVGKDKNEKSVVKNYEIDFYAVKGTKSMYLQVTDNIDDASVRERELKPFRLIRDAIQKIVLVNRPIKTMKLENGMLMDGIVNFLLNLD